MVTPETVVAAEPSHGRGAFPNSWPGTLLFGSRSQVPEPCLVTFVQSINKHSVRPGYALPYASNGPHDGPDLVLAPWNSQPCRETFEDSDHITKFSSKMHMIGSTSAVRTDRESFPEKVICKLIPEAGIPRQRRGGDGTPERGKSEA